MFAWAGALAAGFAAKNTCAELAPCRSAALALGGKPFKLSFCIHSASFEVQGDARAASQRPYINVTVADRSKRTELGDRSQDGSQWRFGETLTLEVKSGEEVVLSMHCSQQYDLVVAALALTCRQIGEACFPISMVLPKLQMEDRDIDGIIYVTPRISFDLIDGGAKVGKVVMSLETKQPPPAQKPTGYDPWCAFGGPKLEHYPVCGDESAGCEDAIGQHVGDMTQRSTARDTPMPSARRSQEEPQHGALSPNGVRQDWVTIQKQASPPKHYHGTSAHADEKHVQGPAHAPFTPLAVPPPPPAPPPRRSGPRF